MFRPLAAPIIITSPVMPKNDCNVRSYSHGGTFGVPWMFAPKLVEPMEIVMDHVWFSVTWIVASLTVYFAIDALAWSYVLFSFALVLLNSIRYQLSQIRVQLQQAAEPPLDDRRGRLL